nr:hypothetical protein [uncultured Chryseobacterium sp.]
MKNLKKLSKRDLKLINGGNIPQCQEGYKACLVQARPIKWDCLLAAYPCPLD